MDFISELPTPSLCRYIGIPYKAATIGTHSELYAELHPPQVKRIRTSFMSGTRAGAKLENKQDLVGRMTSQSRS